MGSNSAVGIQTGAGANIDTYQVGSGDHQQFVREAPASAVDTPNTWTIATTGATNVVAGAESRRVCILTNTSGSATVYLRYDGTAPTTSVWHDAIAPGGRLVVEKELVTMPISMVGSVALGVVTICTATAA